MKAIINNIEYNLLNHYAEQNGIAHIFLRGDYSIDELKNNIKDSEEILIIDDNEQQIASYVGYTKIRQFFMTIAESGIQIELTLEADNIVTSVENAQKKILNITESIKNLLASVETLTNNDEAQSDKISNLEESLKNLVTFQQETTEQLTSIQATIADIQENIENISNQISTNSEIPIEEPVEEIAE